MIERDFSICRAAADNEVAVHGHVLERHIVGANQGAALDVLVITALYCDIAADDIRKNLCELGAGDVIQRGKDFAATVDIVSAYHRANVG